ncbi:SLC13 family permease [Bhargavaea ginsengi]|uniref:SLC13 family permease n=1 Tax=Bhargavaea ginsengi TaxID=426757 RepID=UPI003C766C8F
MNALLNRRAALLLAIGLMILFAGINQPAFLSGFSGVQQMTLLLLIIAVYFWIAAPIPSGAASLLLLALMFLFGLAETVEDTLRGFLSPALYFVLVLSLLSKALVAAEVDQVIAKILIKLSKGGPAAIIAGLPAFILALPIFLPSAAARYKIMEPLMARINSLYGYPHRSLFHKYSLFLIGMVNQNATMIVFTGGGFPILAHQLLKDYGVAELTWLEWFAKVAPPLWIGAVAMVLFMWQYLKRSVPEAGLEAKVAAEADSLEEERKPLGARFWIVMAGFILMILAWMFLDEGKVPLIVPPIILIALFALPKMGLITNQTVRQYDWETFLMLGAAFSLGLILAENGTADALAGLLTGLIPEDAGVVVKVAVIALIIFALRFFFIIPSGALVVIFPIVISYSELIGIEPVQLAFLVILIVGSMLVLPIHSIPTYLAFETKVIEKREQYVIGVVFSGLFTVISIVAAVWYW